VFWYEPLRSWIVARHAACLAVLRNNEAFGTDWRRVGEEVPPSAKNLQSLDPPEQIPVRRLFLDAVRAQDARAFARVVDQRSRELLAALREQGSFDFVTEFAEPLALSAITYLLGVPELDPAWFAPLSTAIADGMDAGLRPELLEPANAARAELADLGREWLAGRPSTGVAGFLVRRGGAGDVGLDLVAASLRVMLLAGYASTSKLLTLAAIELLRGDRGLARYAHVDPALATEELIRHTSVVQAVARICVADTDLAGVRVRAGDAVTLLLGAANHDPTRFVEPAKLKLDRAHNPHLGFGRGTHSCIGAHFAMVQARIVFTALAEVAPEVRMLGEPKFRRTVTHRTVDRLDVQ
jgi:cytochrome P450